MTDGLLIFTFSPVQSFIAEARRAADLYTGSRILVELAGAAAQAIGVQRLIYPAPLCSGRLPDDVPNKMVARVPWEDCEQIAEEARLALLRRWREIADEAKAKFLRIAPPPDGEWQAIWNRQTKDDYLWEVYWAAADLEEESRYREACEQAERALAAVKRARPFVPASEPGVKDSLSGRRQALRTGTQDATDYWDSVVAKGRVTPAKLRSAERLDAFGVIKRFSEIADRKVEPYFGFPSTSSVASGEFLERARPHMRNYRAQLERAVASAASAGLIIVRQDADWPYDGDLLYRDALVVKRFQDDHRITVAEGGLDDPRKALSELYKSAGGPPSPYYAIVVLDGDGMGERVNQCRTPEEHQLLSQSLTTFAGQVAPLAIKHQAAVIYNGGDDVLAMVPLITAFEFAHKLAEMFHQVTKGTASAGIAVVHHQFPLNAALRAAHQAESRAKRVAGKAAVCVTTLKRSGETLEMRSKWADADSLFTDLVNHFACDHLSTKFAYDLADEAHIGTGLPPDAREALIKRLVKRHKTDKLTDPNTLVQKLHEWSILLDDRVPKIKNETGDEVPQGLVELGKWLVFARFVGQGGAE